MSRFAGAARIVTVLIVLALVVGLVVVFGSRDTSSTLTADFTQTNSLYEGSDVRILGVGVGTVDKLTPRGETVRATISYDADVKLPADVKAVVVSPSIVGDRFVQLTPAYDGGETLKDGASLGVDRTAVPVELDQVYSSLDDLAVALGPDGANKDGAVSDLVDDTAAQLDGQGAQLNETLRNFGRLSQTLSDNKDELFGSLREVNQFVDLLQRNDESVRSFFDSTAEVSRVLEGERDDLQATLKALSEALISVRGLVKENRGELKANVEQLATVAEVLGKHSDDLEEFTVSAPTALSNVALAYNGNSGTLDNHADILQLLLGAVPDLGSVVCAGLQPLGAEIVSACETVGGTVGDLLRPIFGALGDALAPDGDPQPDPSATAEGEVAPDNGDAVAPTPSATTGAPSLLGNLLGGGQ